MESPIIQYLQQYQLLAVFVGSILFGESVIVPAILLSAQGIFSPVGVFFAAFFGTVVADIGWFLLGRHGIDLLAKFSSRVRERYASYIEQVEHRNERKRLIFFILFKFIYGVRILTIIYFSLHRMPFMRFVGIVAAGTLIWLSVAFAVAWPAWRFLSERIPSFESLQFMLLGILGAAILFRIIIQWASKRIIKP